MKFLSPLILCCAIVVVSCNEPDATTGKTPTVCYHITDLNPKVGEVIQFQNCSKDAVSFLWDFNGESTSTQENPTYAFSSVGLKPVRLTIVDKDNHTASYQRDVTIRDDKGSIYGGEPSSAYFSAT